MRYIILTIFIFFFLIPTGLSLNITSCKSDTTNWLCARNTVCVCDVSGTCNNGNLLVYEYDLNSLLCAPKITNNKAFIDWSICNTELDSVKIRADCDEWQTAEKMIILSGPLTTVGTTSVATTVLTTVATTTEYTGMCGDEGYCEKIENNCLTSYEDCQEYDDECSADEKCCCPSTETTTPSGNGGFNTLWIIPIIIVVIVVLVYFFFIRGREREAILTFKRLYEKWSR